MTTHTHAATNPWISRRALSSWQGFGLLTWKSFLKLVLNPAMFAFALILPIFMYMMFGAGQEYSKEWAINANIGATVLVSMTLYGVMIAAASAATVVALERTSGISRLFALSPVGSGAFIFSRLIAAISMSALVIVITYTFGYATGARMRPEAWVESGLITLAASVISAALGLALAFLMRSDTAFAVINGVVVLGAFLAGMFIPISSMGSIFKTLAPYSPFYGLFNLSQLPLYGFDNFEWKWVISTVAWFVPMALLAVWAQRRDTDR